MPFPFIDWDHDELTVPFTMNTKIFTSVGMSVTVTTTSATDKVWLMASLPTSSNAAGNAPYLKFLRNGATDVLIGDAAGSRVRTLGCGSSTNEGDTAMTNCGLIAVDQPGVAGNYTYTVVMRVGDVDGSAVVVNRGDFDTNNDLNGRGASELTAFVISANV